MARFRSKPGFCEAEQFHGFYGTPYPPGVMMEDHSNDPPGPLSYERYEFYVVTTHGQKTKIVDGDYIVREPDGNGYYPVKPEIFEKRWEPDEVAPDVKPADTVPCSVCSGTGKSYGPNPTACTTCHGTGRLPKPREPEWDDVIIGNG